jgi:hypothetical protein
MQCWCEPVNVWNASCCWACQVIVLRVVVQSFVLVAAKHQKTCSRWAGLLFSLASCSYQQLLGTYPMFTKWMQQLTAATMLACFGAMAHERSGCTNYHHNTGGVQWC